MHLTEARIAVRPRPAWEAIDLGVRLAGEHRRLLMLSWALITLPLLALLTALLWDYPSAAMLLFWWLKPLYERLPLLILSRALFGTTPGLGEALKAWPATLKTQLIPSLLWRRLSLLRSFTLPVQQLEGLSGAARARRLGVLCQADARAARCLTLAGAHLEMVLYTAAILLIYAFVPRQMDMDWSGLLLLGSDEDFLWVEHLFNLLYALTLILWGPVYVACGFTLYLNRRTRLEAWDIELTFRRLRQRLAGVATALLLGTGLCMASLPSAGWAASAPNEAAPDSARLTHQPLNSQQAQQAISELLDNPPFKNPQTLTGWRLPETARPEERAQPDGSARLDWLNRLLQGAGLLARGVEVLLWGLVIGVAILVAWRYRQWLRLFAAPTPKSPVAQPEAAAQRFGLPVAAHNLPEDIVASARGLWASQPREALSLLYRALLSRLISDHRLPLSSADTEEQALQRIALLANPALVQFSRVLTGHWQSLAYGHQLPDPEAFEQLCNDWQRLFEAEQPAAGART